MKTTKKMTRTHITEIKAHKVRRGETLESIAKANGLTWQMLARFNWGTAQPDQINKHLVADVGCTKRTKDRKNYILDDSDDPGIIYIPKPWRIGNLATKHTHIIRVRTLPPDEPMVYLFSI